MTTPKKKTIILFILAVIIMYVVVEVLPTLGGAMADTEVLEYGKLKVSDEVKLYIVRDETVYKAPEDGEIKVFTDEGTLIKRGGKVMDFKDAPKKNDQVKEDDDKGSAINKDIVKRLGDSMVAADKTKSGRKGIFSRYVDGYEGILKPKNIDDLKESDFTGIGQQPEKLDNIVVAKGDPIYKIADNSMWYMVFWIDEDDIGKYEKEKRLSVKLGKTKVDAIVNKVVSEDGKFRVVLRTNRYYSGFMKHRFVDANVITTDSEGLLIPNDCLTTKDKEVGCYVRNTAGDYVFTRVQTLGTDGEMTLVTEKQYFDEKGKPVNTVKAYDEVKRK